MSNPTQKAQPASYTERLIAYAERSAGCETCGVGEEQKCQDDEGRCQAPHDARLAAAFDRLETGLARPGSRSAGTTEAARLTSAALENLNVADGRLLEDPEYSRGLALIGIGEALCSIALSLDQVADVLSNPIVTASNEPAVDPVAASCHVEDCTNVRTSGYLQCFEHAGKPRRSA